MMSTLGIIWCTKKIRHSLHTLKGTVDSVPCKNASASLHYKQMFLHLLQVSFITLPDLLL